LPTSIQNLTRLIPQIFRRFEVKIHVLNLSHVNRGVIIICESLVESRV